MLEGLRVIAGVLVRFPQRKMEMEASHVIKPGIGEATRVLLRREAQLLLLQDLDSEATRHLRWLAESKSIPIAVFKDLPYRAVALIKEIEL